MENINEFNNIFCTDKVDYKTIDELTIFEQPAKYIVKSTNYDDEYKTPVLTAGQTFILGYTNEEDGIYNASKEKPVIIFDDFTGAFKWVDFPFKVKSSAMKIITTDDNKLLIRFLYHMMEFLNFTSDEHKRLWISTYSKIKIAVPPIKVQNEIIKILDNFMALSDTLSMELEDRKKQYEFYRDYYFDSLLNEKKYLLGDVVEFLNGRAYKQEELLNEGKYKVLRVGNFGTNDRWYYSNLELEDDKYCNVGDLLYLWSASFGPQIWRDGKTIYHYHIWKIKHDEKILDKKFLFYFFDYDKEKLQSLKTNSTMAHISMGNMKTREISIPNMDKQIEIAKNLDFMYELVNEKLPAEIEARKKQYDFYCTKLLTFEMIGDKA